MAVSGYVKVNIQLMIRVLQGTFSGRTAKRESETVSMQKKGIVLTKINMWKSAEELAEKVIEAFSKADVFIKTNLAEDVIVIKIRYDHWARKQEPDYASDL